MSRAQNRTAGGDPGPIVVYIASASRSGSTVLDQVLGDVQGVVGVGELRRISDFAAENSDAIRDPANRRGCTCGTPVSTCTFWNEVATISGIDLRGAGLSSRLGRLDRLLFRTSFLVFGSGITRRISAAYRPFKSELDVAENFMRIYSAVARTAGAKCVVDSSKMTHQFILLKVARPEQVKLVALYRDGRAVSKSIIRGDRINFFMKGMYAEEPVRAFREAAKYWIKSAVQLMAVFARVGKGERYFLRYEDFCRAPEFHVRGMLRKFGVIGYGEELGTEKKASHNIGGSPSRFSFGARNIDIDDAWRNAWTAEDRKHFGFFGALVNALLGYKE